MSKFTSDVASIKKVLKEYGELKTEAIVQATGLKKRRVLYLLKNTVNGLDGMFFDEHYDLADNRYKVWRLESGDQLY